MYVQCAVVDVSRGDRELAICGWLTISQLIAILVSTFGFAGLVAVAVRSVKSNTDPGR